ncbi:PAS domain-containing protein [Luteolibacter pohnpeiensis]|uniref:histidine kinase n=1 Tax=Luteolibacter pohnpeiensis TaxID=454153 RepID=A0A934S739_9BACT|nr:ATP-binding protein [Luteolibacter pohnpeiensis]MBK1880932.1 PAS domain-containing protein [Luteolibacter pohnpeiensis]
MYDTLVLIIRLRVNLSPPNWSDADSWPNFAQFPALLKFSSTSADWFIQPIPDESAFAFLGELHEANLWQEHYESILFVALIIIVQLGLIIGLLAARRKARRADESLTLAAEAAHIGLWRREANSSLVVATDQFRKIFDLPTLGPLDLKLVHQRLHPDDRERVTKVIEGAATAGQGFRLEHRIVCDDGSTRWIASHGRSQSGGNSRGYSAHGASMDITDRYEAAATADLHRQELAHLSRISSLGVLSGALAHELNQPLGIILSNAQAAEYLLESDHPDLGELRAMISDIIREDCRAGDVIKRLRALLRRGDKKPQLLNVNENAEDVLRIMNSDLIRRGVSITTSFAHELPPVLMESVQLQQVLLNLIVNACDAMERNDPSMRSITLRTFTNGSDVCIAVQDRGCGLPTNPENIFQPFYTTKLQGLGLGLSICRTLITAHGGRLWAEPNKHEGASFIISLPMAST